MPLHGGGAESKPKRILTCLRKQHQCQQCQRFALRSIPLQSNLTLLNNQVATSFTAISNARLARNALLYNHENSICSIAAEVKQYIKALFGANSPEFEQIKGIALRPIKP